MIFEKIQDVCIEYSYEHVNQIEIEKIYSIKSI